MTISAWIYATAFPATMRRSSPSAPRAASAFSSTPRSTQDRRTIGFKLTNSSRRSDVPLWHDDAADQHLVLRHRRLQCPTAQTLDVYLNGVLDNGTLLGTVTSSQQNSPPPT